MTQDVSTPTAENDPVAAALRDPQIRNRLEAAARTFLSKWQAGWPLIQRTEEAKVVVQDAAMRALRHRDRFDGSKDVLNWLVGFVLNVVRESAKKRPREATGPPADGPGLADLAIDPGRPVEESVADGLLVRHLLDQLAPLDQSILRMKYTDGLTCAEIGQRLGTTENAVRARVFRATERLKQLCGLTGEGRS